MKRSHQPFYLVTPTIVLIPACGLFFLLIVAFGYPPQAQGLDSAWMEVLAWGFLNHEQWGRDLVFTYGPLGFLHPFSAYVSGIFWWFAAGQIALPATFAVAIGMMFHRRSSLQFGLFALAYAGCFYKLPGDISWALTLPFATTFLINRCKDNKRGATVYPAILLLAPILAAIALTKFSILMFWVLCVATASAVCMYDRNARCALLILFGFPLALLAVWSACGQEVLNLPWFLSTGLEVASGYAHAMGSRAPFAIDAVGLAVLFCFITVCAHVAWSGRANRAAMVSVGLTPVCAVFFWLAFFTRGDEYHWPGFFAAMSLLPFALMCNRYLTLSRTVSTVLIVLVATCVSIGFIVAPPDALLRQALSRFRSNLHDLAHLPQLRDQREAEWRATSDSAALPKIRARVGNARVDMVPWQQQIILLNGLNYAPRPVFQSYAAFTPKLSRLNETYFLQDSAPDFVVFKLEYSDNRVPMSEDGLALIALLERYRPVLIENGFVLLERDASVKRPAAIAPPKQGVSASLGTNVPLTSAALPEIAFLNIELNSFGKIYTLLFREPALNITIDTTDGEQQHHRLIRLTAASGFLLDPVLESTHDWLKLYFSKPLPRVRSVRIDTESPWERMLFQRDITVEVSPVNVLHSDSAASPDISSVLYPGFNLEPAAPGDLRVIMEGDQESVFLHAPSSIDFKPVPGHYKISATFGIQAAALKDAGCSNADPDGVGISLILRHAGNETVLWHREVDPFHVAPDSGPQHFLVYNVEVGPGDKVVYRVDQGHGGENARCDWTYVRDLKFISSTDIDYYRIHANGFD